VKKGDARPLDDDFSKPPSAAEEAKAASEWAELVRRIAPRLGRRLQVDLGPVSSGTLKGLRKVGPLSPRERGVASMERGLRHAFRVVSQDKSYRFIRGMIISSMCSDVDDITDLVDELVADNEKAGLLMEKIAALAAHWAAFERDEGAAAPRRELASYEALHATRKGGGDDRGAQLHADALAKWDGEPKRLWEVSQRDLPLDDPRRLTNDQVRDLILDEAADFIMDKKGIVPSSGTVEGHIRRWRRAAGMSNEKRRRA
jgi:hypothetical protein